jgi:hypothetical protein
VQFERRTVASIGCARCATSDPTGMLALISRRLAWLFSLIEQSTEMRLCRGFGVKLPRSRLYGNLADDLDPLHGSMSASACCTVEISAIW